MSSDLTTSMKGLLAEAEASTEAIQARLKTLGDSITMAAKYLPKVSRRGGSGGQDEVAILQAEIEELEYQRETSSLGLAAERDIVRKIAALKKQQTQFVDFAALKSERKRLNDELDALFARRSELRDALRTNAMTERIRALNPGVSVAVSDITHAMLQLPQGVVGRVVGKAGASRVQIEKDCGVLIDVNDGADGSGIVNFKITGIASGIAAATTRIDELTSQEEETLEINGGLANLLLTRSGAGIRQLEADTGARVQLSRHEHRVTLVGAPRCVSEAKSWLATVQDSRVIMTVPPAVLPAVIGKGGSNFRRIQETYGVEIDLQKPVVGEPVGAGFTLTVWGIEPAALESARGELLHLISSNTKHAIAVEIDPAMVPFLVASAAERVKAFQKAHDVSMSVKRSGAARGTPSIEGVVVPPGATAWVEFSGVRAALDAATTAFALDVAEFDRTCVRVRLTAAQARALIGKSGEGAKKLRADTGVSIDVEVGGASGGPGADARRHQQLYDLLPNEAVVILRSDDATKLEAARVAVTAIADNYLEQAFEVPDAVCFALIKNGGEVITKLQADTGAKVDIARATGKVTVSGSREAVTAAAVVIKDLLATNYSCVVAFDDADIVGAIVGKKGENIRKLQEGLDVHIDIDKKHNQVVIRGRREAADAAAARVQEFIERHAKENAVLNVDLEAIPSLIGKDGANIRKLQDDTGAQIDINSTTGDVRVKGPEEAVKAAVAAITVLCGLDKAKAQVPYDERAIAGFLGKAGANVTALADEYKVTLTLNRGKKCVVIRGEAADVEAAKAVVAKRLKELVRVEETINFPVARLPYLMGAKGSRIRQLQAVTGVLVDVPKLDTARTGRTAPVVIKGQDELVRKSKALFEAIGKGQSVNVLQLLPHHAAELAGRSSRNLERMKILDGAVIDVNVPASTVTIIADDASIVKVTTGVENVLTFTFSAEYQMIAMPGSLLQQLSADASAPKGQSKSRAAAGGDDTAESTDVTLTQLAASSGAKLWSNMDGGYVTVCGTAAQVATAKAALLAFVASASERYAELPVQEWMIPSVVGSKGTNITQLQQATGTKLDVDRVKLLVTIQGPSKESIQAAKLALETLIAKLAAQRNVIPASAAGIGAIIGRGGATIRRLQDETGAFIDLDKEGGFITVRGSSAEAVAAASQRVQDILAEVGGSAGDDASVIEKRITVDRRSISAVIGPGGSTVRDIQDNSGARVTVDRDALQVVIRGSEDAVLSAIAAVKAALAEDKRAGGEDGADGDRPSRKHGDSKSDAPIKQTDTKPVPTFPVVPVGASEETQEALLAATGNKMNKNARRRAARKKAGASAREDGPEWVDGLAGVTDQPDAILAKLLASSAAPAPLSTPVRSLPRPPPGLAPAASPPQEDASGILAQLRSLSVTAPAPAAAEVAPAVSEVPLEHITMSTKKDDKKPEEPVIVSEGSEEEEEEEEEEDGEDAAGLGGSDDPDGVGSSEEGDPESSDDDGPIVAVPAAGDGEEEEEEEEDDEEDFDEDDSDDEDFGSDDAAVPLSALYESGSDDGEESDESYEVGDKRGHGSGGGQPPAKKR